MLSLVVRDLDEEPPIDELLEVFLPLDGGVSILRASRLGRWIEVEEPFWEGLGDQLHGRQQKSVLGVLLCSLL